MGRLLVRAIPLALVCVLSFMPQVSGRTRWGYGSRRGHPNEQYQPSSVVSTGRMLIIQRHPVLGTPMGFVLLSGAPKAKTSLTQQHIAHSKQETTRD